MYIEFYGATVEAQKCVNTLLRLPASGCEQDWEIELADVSRVREMLDVFAREELDFDSRCALALLIIASVDEAESAQVVKSVEMDRLASLLKSDEGIRGRMEFYWIQLSRANNLELIKKLLD